MKILTRFFLLTVFFNISYNCIGQIDFEKEYKKLKIIVSDSLKGFDEQLIKKIAIEQGFLGKETYAYLLRNARQYINHKYGIIENITQSKTGNSQTMGPPCNNEDFEAGNSSGWTLQSQSWTSGPCVGNTFSAGAPEFWVLATPIADPQFPGGIPNSPLGGNFVAKLNDVNPTGGSTMMRQTFPVTSNNCLFQFAWAACFDGSGHGCCDNPFLTIRVLDCNNNVLSCPQISIVASGPSCSSGMPGFTQNSSGYMIKNWTQQAIDLTPYIGSCVTIEVFVADCTGGAHHGYAYFDALCSPMYVSVNNIQYPITTNTIFACGITNANIAAPPGLGPYNWNGPPGSGINNLNQQSFNTSTPGTYTLTVNPTGGCGPITRTLNIQFQPNPNAGFNMVNNCQNFTITNTGSGPPSIQTYSFIGSSAPASFTTTSTTTNVSFSAGGQYTVLQSVFNGSCSANHSIVINVPNPLIVNFNVSNVCQNTPVTFTNTSNPITGVNHFWDFDNNGIWDSNNPSPSNLYAPGNYTVKLKVVAPSGCVDSISKPVSVWGRAVPDFTFNPVCYGTPVNFTNNTSTTANPNTGSISLYQWYFGDGNQSNASGPSHLYASPSNSVTNTTYSIKLVVTTSNGCKDSVQKNITVFSNPSANFIADSVCLGNLTTLQDLSNGNGNPLFQFQWDFNNDNTPDLINNSLSTQYQFPVSGNNVVNYTVVTNTGAGTLTCKSFTTKNVWVHYIPVPVLTHTNQCIYNQPTPFDASGSSVQFGTLTYHWNFGDGNSNPSGGATIQNHYQNPGNYIVTLILTSNNGCSVQTTQNIEVWDTPKGHFSYTKHCFGKPTTLVAHTATNSAPISQFNWDLNNNPSNYEITSSSSGSYTFPTPGNQTVNLYLTSIHGCTNVISGNVFVNYNPVAKFYAPKRSGCTDLCIKINDSSYVYGSGNIVQWIWDYGNGIQLNTAQSISNTVCYSNESHTSNKLYHVKLTVKTDSGCVDSLKLNNYITVYPKPLADFTWKGEDGDLLTPFIQFYNQSIGHFYSHWFFNDGINNSIDSVSQNPKYYYDTDIPRDYQVWLAVRNYYGCKDTIAKYVRIEPIFIIYFPNAFTPNGDNINEFFTGRGVGIKQFKLWIFDRWGEQLFYTNDINEGWDGRKKGDDQILKSDVYVWKAEVQDFRGKWHKYNGHVTLLK